MEVIYYISVPRRKQYKNGKIRIRKKKSSTFSLSLTPWAALGYISHFRVCSDLRGRSGALALPQQLPTSYNGLSFRAEVVT